MPPRRAGARPPAAFELVRWALMSGVRRLGWVVLLVAVGCDTGGAPPQQAKTAASVAPVEPEPPPEPPLVSKDVAFESSGDVSLAGRLFLAKDPTAPVLVMVHRYRGDSSEWQPFAKRMAASKKRYTIVTFDLRGHGRSKAVGEGSMDWADMKPKDMPKLVTDVHAAIRFGLDHTNDLARGVVLVGSSLGAALAAKAASEEQKVVAVGLVSPGAAINGFDVYEPFASVRTLPSFLAGGAKDNVSREPLASLFEMAKTAAILKTYPGNGHGAHGLSRQKNTLWADLEDWLLGVFEETPTPGRVPKTAEKSVKAKAMGR